jgi:DNA-binding IclR family transcriptional regulator
VQSIERTFSVLRAVSAGGGSVGGSVGVSEVSRATGLAKSTCSRILASLDDLGIVERIDDAGRFVIGAGLISLAGSGTSPSSLRELARPELLDLADRLGECAGLAVPDGRDGLYVDQVPGPGHVQVTDWTGHRFPLHTIAAGQALMGGWSDTDVAAYAADGLDEFTPHTVTTLVGLRQRVGEVRRTGVAWTIGEFSEEISGWRQPCAAPTAGRWRRSRSTAPCSGSPERPTPAPSNSWCRKPPPGWEPGWRAEGSASVVSGG